MRRRMLWAVLCLFVPVGTAYAAFPASPESAQQSASQAVVRGRVVDSSNGLIVGAQVTATSERAGAPTATVTNQQGEYELTLLPGAYVVLRLRQRLCRELAQHDADGGLPDGR